MDDRTKKALLASIANWERNTTARLVDAKFGATNCKLCIEFARGNGDCRGCPVAENTGFASCMATPYYVAVKAYNLDDGDAFRKAAQDEVAFLKSLLPGAAAAGADLPGDADRSPEKN